MIKAEQEDITRIHSGLPQLISKKMVDLIIGNGYKITIDEDGDIDEENQERLDTILDANNFKSILQTAIETESWSGGVALKLSINPQFQEPIIEVIQPENYKLAAGKTDEEEFMKTELLGPNDSHVLSGDLFIESLSKTV